MTHRNVVTKSRAWCVVGVITAVNIFIRCLFLAVPNTPVFDEAFYVRYSTSYCCSHKLYSDLHPPLPKLILGIPGYFSNYKGDYPFDQKGPAATYDSVKLPIVPMRAIVAIVGSLVPVEVFALVTAIGGTPAIGLLTVAMISLENANMVDSSFALLNQFLLFGIFGALLFYVYSQDATSKWSTNGYAAISGLFLAVAIGTKFTGICAAAAIVFDLSIRTLKKRTMIAASRSLRIALWGLFTFAVVYLGTWVLHEWILSPANYVGLGWHVIQKMSDQIVTNHWTIVQGHLSLGPSDTYGSRWWQWLGGYHPLLFWQDESKTIYFFPNLILWCGSVFLLLFQATLWGLGHISNIGHVESRSTIRYWGLILVALGVNYLPNIEIRRVLYLYHFLPSLILVMILNGLCIQRLGLVHQLRHPREWKFFIGILTVFLIGSVLTIPFSHGLTGQVGRAIKERMDQEIKWR
jgi:dolichyl-phosphate-mannose--protein O-mannosyl transferase